MVCTTKAGCFLSGLHFFFISLFSSSLLCYVWQSLFWVFDFSSVVTVVPKGEKRIGRPHSYGIETVGPIVCWINHLTWIIQAGVVGRSPYTSTACITKQIYPAQAHTWASLLPLIISVNVKMISNGNSSPAQTNRIRLSKTKLLRNHTCSIVIVTWIISEIACEFLATMHTISRLEHISRQNTGVYGIHSAFVASRSK